MKKITYLLSILLIMSLSVLAEKKTDKFKVYGSCNMCKARIEKAAKTVETVSSAIWNKETKMIEVTYDSKKIKVIDIHKAIAKVGHDTDLVKADDKVYNMLPGCCKYERASKKKACCKKEPCCEKK